MDPEGLFVTIGIALGLGLLVGLERERTHGGGLGGIRTFPLVTVLGTVCGLLAERHGGQVIAAGLLAVAALIAVANRSLASHGSASADAGAGPEPAGATASGLTTQAALLLMFADGVYLAHGHRAAGIVVGAGVAVLLQFKGELHGFAERLGDQDIRAIMQFALLSLVILPVLPDRTYGPYDVLNPRHVWLMVVLIVGISLLGYVAWKWWGQRASIAAGGILGGLISSTATTVSYARRARLEPSATGAAAAIILIASAVVFVRILAEIAVAGPALLKAASPVLLPPFALLLLAASLLGLRATRDEGTLPAQSNPTELKSALGFAALYAVVLFAVAAVKDRFGASGLMVVAGLSGLTDVDAITLSTARMVEGGRLPAEAGARIVLLAALSNIAFKTAMAGVLGGGRLLRQLALPFGGLIAVGVAWLVLG